MQRKTSLGTAQNLVIAGTAPLEAKTHTTTPLCESKACTETVKSGSVGLQTPAATPDIGAFPSPIVANQAYEFSKFQFRSASPAPFEAKTHVGTSLFGCTASTETVEIGNVGEQTLDDIVAVQTSFGFHPLSRRGKGKRR